MTATSLLPETLRPEQEREITFGDLCDRIYQGNTLPYLPAVQMHGVAYETNQLNNSCPSSNVVFEEPSLVFATMLDVTESSPGNRLLSVYRPMFWDEEVEALSYTYHVDTNFMLRSLWIPEDSVECAQLFYGSTPFWEKSAQATTKKNVQELVGTTVSGARWNAKLSLGGTASGSL